MKLILDNEKYNGISENKRKLISNKIGYIFQDFKLFEYALLNLVVRREIVRLTHLLERFLLLLGEGLRHIDTDVGQEVALAITVHVRRALSSEP